MNEPKPLPHAELCPFCGREPRIRNIDGFVFASCPAGCVDSPDMKTVDDALDWWNRRALPVMPDAVSKLIDMAEPFKRWPGVSEAIAAVRALYLEDKG